MVRWRIRAVSSPPADRRIRQPYRVPVGFNLARGRPARSGAAIKTLERGGSEIVFSSGIGIPSILPFFPLLTVPKGVTVLFPLSSCSQSSIWPSARNRLSRAFSSSNLASSASASFHSHRCAPNCSAFGVSCGADPGPLPDPFPSSSCASTLFSCSPAICSFRLAISASVSSSRKLPVSSAIWISFCR